MFNTIHWDIGIIWIQSWFSIGFYFEEVTVSDLQEETRALRHEDNSDERSQRREETHQDK